MKNITKALLIAGSILLSGCMNQHIKEDVQINASGDPKVQLASFSTYSWVMGADILVDADKKWKVRSFDLDSEVRFQINRVLREKGLEENNYKPQLGLVYALGANMDLERLVENKELDVAELKNTPEGALGIMLIDVETRKPVWVAEGLAAIQEGNTDAQAKKRVAYIIDEMFESFGK